MSQSSPVSEYVPTPSLETRVRAITRIPLIKIAAECHRRKWQFSHDEEARMPAAEARRLVRLAFDTLHSIGDMAHKAAEELRSAPKDQTDGVAQEAKGALEVRQHIAWLFQYVQGMNERNWHDMKLRAERQLEQLSLEFPGPAFSSTPENSK